MHRFVSPFEIVTEAFASHREADISPWPALAELGETEDCACDGMADATAVTALTQRLVLRFLAEGWHVFCLPPGINYRNLPFAQAIARAHGSAPGDIAGHWLLLAFDKDGRRSGPLPLKTAPVTSAPFGRECAIIKCHLTHAMATPAESRAEGLDGLRRCEEALGNGNPAELRQLLRTLPSSESDAWGRSFFGAIWDIVDVLSRSEADGVAPGTWRFPDAPQRELRTRVAILEDACRALVVPATFCAGTLRLHMLEWLSLSAAPSAQACLALVDTVAIAHSLWLTAAVSQMGAALTRSGEIRVPAAVANLQRVLSGQQEDTRLPGALIARVGLFLTRNGHADWADRLNACVRPALVPDVPDHVVVRRLRGLRVVGRMTLREAALAIGISCARASYLTHKKFRGHQVDPGWLERDATRLVHTGHDGSLARLTELLQSGALSPSAFDAFESLQPSGAAASKEGGHDD